MGQILQTVTSVFSATKKIMMLGKKAIIYTNPKAKKNESRI